MAETRPNRAKRKLQAGQPVLAPHFPPNSADADIIDQFGHLGLIDVAWFEMEHGPITWDRLSDFSRACDLWGITSLTRVDQNDPSTIGHALTRGMQSVMVPHVNTREDAERAVRSSLYPPKGMRRGGGRQAFGVTDYSRKANDETMVVVLIEDVQTISNLRTSWASPTSIASSSDARISRRAWAL